MNKHKKLISLLLVAATFLTVCVGSLAYFTDRVQGSVTATAGTLELSLSEISATNKNELIPGHGSLITYTLDNIGSKSADILETIIITVKDANGNPVNLSTITPEFALYKSSDVSIAESTGLVTVTGTPISTVSGNKITYSAVVGSTNQFILNGQGNAAEIETGGLDVYNGSYVLVFSKTAGNAFANLTLELEYIAQAKQHRNTNDDAWAKVMDETFTFGNGTVIDAVPEK